MTHPEFRLTIPLRWRDMDMLGHLNQAVYHELLEEGRAGFVAQDSDIAEMPWVLARVELDYRHEVRHADGSVEVVVRVGRVGTKSVTLEHDVVLPSGTLAAAGTSVLVAWDPAGRHARELSASERDAFAKR